MSAAQAHIAYSPFSRRSSEVELLRSIGNVTWNSDFEESALASIGTAVLRLPEFVGFSFQPLEALPHLPVFETSKPRLTVLSASAQSSVSANGQSWGHVHLLFVPQFAPTVESPVRLAKFVGQQIGILFHRIALERQRQKLVSRLEAMEQILRRRKVIHRAAGILAKQRNLSQSEAIALMVSYARLNHRSLLDISDALIFGYESAAFTRPYLRPLAGHEPTASI